MEVDTLSAFDSGRPSRLFRPRLLLTARLVLVPLLMIGGRTDETE